MSYDFFRGLLQLKTIFRQEELKTVSFFFTIRKLISLQSFEYLLGI